MPVDVVITFKDGTKQLHYIPMYLMFWCKTKWRQYIVPAKVYPSWKWTHPTYTVNWIWQTPGWFNNSWNRTHAADGRCGRRNNKLELKWWKQTDIKKAGLTNGFSFIYIIFINCFHPVVDMQFFVNMINVFSLLFLHWWIIQHQFLYKFSLRQPLQDFFSRLERTAISSGTGLELATAVLLPEQEGL